MPKRVRALGAPAERVQVSGNLKYDLELPRQHPYPIGLPTSSSEVAGLRSSLQAVSLPPKNLTRSSLFETLQGEYPKAF